MFQALPSIVEHSGTTSQLSLPILMTARLFLFKDIERGLDARTTTSLTIDKTEADRSESFSAKIEKLGSYSSVKGELGVFTGKVALALYNDKNERVKIFNSTASDQTWASIFTSMSFDVADINFKGIADGTTV